MNAKNDKNGMDDRDDMANKNSQDKSSDNTDGTSDGNNNQKPHGERFLWFDYFSKKNPVDLTIIATLAKNKLFKELSSRELEYIGRVVHQRQYQPGEVIFSQFEKGLGMYMIARGSVEVRLANSTVITALGEGSFFGELALIDDHNKRTASAFAKGPTTLLGFFKPDLMQIIERKPDVGVKILIQLSKILGKRLTETTELISQMTVRIDKDAPA